MKTTLIALSIAALVAFGSASAAPSTAASPAGAKTAQQTKMGACATANKGKKGAEYKAAMSSCLKAPAATAASPKLDTKIEPAKTAPTATRGNASQKAKMASCAAANKGKKGDDYKNGMSTCLKAEPASGKKP